MVTVTNIKCREAIKDTCLNTPAPYLNNARTRIEFSKIMKIWI